MTEFENYTDQNKVVSKTLRAERRTYFFDMKSTKSDQRFLTITESKRRFDNESGTFFYEKHKIFVYEEDFENFRNILKEIITDIKQPNPEPDIQTPSQNEDLSQNEELIM